MALRKKIYIIEEERQKEQEEIKRLGIMTKKQKEDAKMRELRKGQATGLKKKKKTLAEEERDSHEAYQLVLSEYYRRVKQRVKHKAITVTLLKKGTGSQPKCDEDLNTVLNTTPNDWVDKRGKIPIIV